MFKTLNLLLLSSTPLVAQIPEAKVEQAYRYTDSGKTYFMLKYFASRRDPQYIFVDGRSFAKDLEALYDVISESEIASTPPHVLRELAIGVQSTLRYGEIEQEDDGFHSKLVHPAPTAGAIKISETRDSLQLSYERPGRNRRVEFKKTDELDLDRSISLTLARINELLSAGAIIIEPWPKTYQHFGYYHDEVERLTMMLYSFNHTRRPFKIYTYDQDSSEWDELRIYGQAPANQASHLGSDYLVMALSVQSLPEVQAHLNSNDLKDSKLFFKSIKRNEIGAELEPVSTSDRRYRQAFDAGEQIRQEQLPDTTFFELLR